MEAERARFRVVFVAWLDVCLMLMLAIVMFWLFDWPATALNETGALMQLHFMHAVAMVGLCVTVMPRVFVGAIFALITSMLLAIDVYVIIKHLAVIGGSAASTGLTVQTFAALLFAFAFLFTDFGYGQVVLYSHRYYTLLGGEPRASSGEAGTQAGTQSKSMQYI